MEPDIEAFMHRENIIYLLRCYSNTWCELPPLLKANASAYREKAAQQIIRFVNDTPDCCHRTHRAGHLTGSALVVSSDFSCILLTLHRKLGKWLQLGGHADGDTDLAAVAVREAREESGIQQLNFLRYETLVFPKIDVECLRQPIPFDLDCHFIPATKENVEHIHYDIRFLLVANKDTPVIRTSESHELRWFTVEQAKRITDEESMHRQFDKLLFIKRHIDSCDHQSPLTMKV
jgi:8-oxo-dGTP pyrophosphatase MutT (NUDIX family)